MKVTIVCDVLGAPNNGTTMAAYNLINHLKSKGHEVHVICSDEEKKGQEGYHIVPKRHVPIFDNYIAKNGVTLSVPDYGMMEEVLKDMDVIHNLIPFALSKTSIKIAKKYNIPVTCSCHMQAENFTSHVLLQHVEPVNYLLYKRLYHKVYKHAVSIHYPSQFICDYLAKRGYSKVKPYVITNGVPTGIYPKEVKKPVEYQDKCVILYTARYVKEKRQDVLIKALRHSKYLSNIHVIFAGTGPREEYLKKLVKKYKLEDHVSFNLYTREEINDVINYADLYVHPSYIEIEAIAANEASSCGLVPIISNSKKSAAPMFALTERNLFKNGDAKDLAQKIDYWIEHPEAKENLRKRYLQSRNPLSIPQAMEQMEQMLLDAINNHKKNK